MGPIYDRSKERLGTTDVAIIRMRQQLLQAADRLQRGIDPPGLDPTFRWDELLSTERIVLPGEDWTRLATAADPEYVRWVAEEKAAVAQVVTSVAAR
jgi:hypothetical protein